MDTQGGRPQPFFGESLRELVLQEDFRIVERTYAPRMHVPVHWHDRAFVGVTLSGTYTSICNGRKRQFQPGCLSFTPVACPHETHYANHGARVLHLELPLRLLHEFSLVGCGDQTYAFLCGGPSYAAARRLYKEFQAPDGLTPLVLHGLTTYLLTQLFRQGQPASKSPPKWLRTAERFVLKNYADPISLEQIGSVVQMHPVHLAREYKRHYGQTIGERIRELRVETACEELRRTSRSIAEIALATGYSDQSHFSAAFRKYVGVAPSVYRRKHAEVSFANIPLNARKT